MIEPPGSVLNGKALVMAPMAELSHAAFRRLVESFGGCDLYFTEMLSAGALMSVSPYEKFYTDLSPSPEKTVLQLVGSRSEQFFTAAQRFRHLPFAGLDVNMGCSVGTIRNRGWGVELMKNPEEALRIIAGLRRIVPDKWLSVKLRLGEEEDGENLVRFCRNLEAEGVDFITLNPKIRRDGPLRPGRWEYVRLLKDSLKIPVVGNSDIKDWASFSSRKTAASPAGYMVARGCVIRPWIFALLKGKMKDPDFGFSVNLETAARDFMELLREHQPEDFHLSRSRRFFFYFSSNLKFGHRIRYRIQNVVSLTEVKNLITEYFERNPEERILQAD